MCDLAEGSDSPPSEMLKDGAGTIGRSRWGYVDAGSEGPGAGPIGAVPSQENQRPPASAANRFLFANTINRQKLPLLEAYERQASSGGPDTSGGAPDLEEAIREDLPSLATVDELSQLQLQESALSKVCERLGGSVQSYME
uniref:Uncharacterized protein n=1 Tax=Oryza punctata TaxID=4537 RepID=A0A0E0MN33_ORYPU